MMINSKSLKRKSIGLWLIVSLVMLLFCCFPALNGKVKAAGETKDYVVLTIEKMDQNGECSYIQEPIRVSFDSLEAKTPEKVLKVGTGNPEGIETTGPHWGDEVMFKIKRIADASQPSGWLEKGDFGEQSQWFCTVNSTLRKDVVSSGEWDDNFENYYSLELNPGDVVRFVYSIDGGADMGITEEGAKLNKDALIDYLSGIDASKLDSDEKANAFNTAKETAVLGNASLAQINDSFNLLKSAFEGFELIPTTDIVFSKDQPEIGIGQRMDFTMTLQPENTTSTLEVVFSEEGIAAYDESAKQLVGLKEGTVKLMAKAGDFTKEVTVTVKSYPAESIDITPKKPEVMAKKKLQMTAVVQPENTTDKVEWRVEDPTIASVDENGLVTGLKAGQTKIIATAGAVSAERNLAVKTYEGPYVIFEHTDGRIQEVDDHDCMVLSAIDEGRFVLKGTDKSPEWDCSTEYSEDVSEGSGGGDGVGHGTHYWINAYQGTYNPAHPQYAYQEIDAKVIDEDTAWNDEPTVLVSFKIKLVPSDIEEIKAVVDGQTLDYGNPLILQGNESKHINVEGRKKGEDTFKALPDHSYKVLCDDKTVDTRFNTITFGSFGEADFTVRMIDDPSVIAEFYAVSEEVKGTNLEVRVPETQEIDVWSTFSNQYIGITDYEIVFTPDNVSNKGVTWESLNPEIAEFQETHSNGIVPKKAGKASFKVTSNANPELSKTFTIEFVYKAPLEKAELKQDHFEVKAYDKVDFTDQLTLTPEKATERCFDWTVDKEGIIKIKEEHISGSEWGTEGNVVSRSIEGLAPGTVTVTGTPKDQTKGAQPVQFTVTVTNDTSGEDHTDYLKMAKDDRQIGLDYLKNLSTSKYGDEWNLFSILRAGGSVSDADCESYYDSAVKTLKENTRLQPTDQARIVLVLGTMGYDVSNIDDVHVIEEMANNAKLDKASSNQVAFTLLALDSRQYAVPEDAKWTREALVELLLTFQAKDGSFALSQGADSGSVDMTGMCLQALAPYKEDEKVKPAVEQALIYLKDKRTSEAGFVEGGSENSCTASQVLTAMTALGIDPLKAENGMTFGNKNLITNLDKFKAPSGGFDTYDDGKEDAEGIKTMSGQQVTYALDSYIRFAEGRNRLYDLSDVPVINPSVNPDQEAAQAVIDQINALGEITSLDQKAAVEAARSAFDRLTEAQKALVSNEAVLKAAEEKIAALEKEASDQKDQEVAQVVIDQINALGEITSLDQKAAVEAARSAFDGLTEAQKALVSNEAVLKAAEEKIAALEKGEPSKPEEPKPTTPPADSDGENGGHTQTQVENTGHTAGNVSTGLAAKQEALYKAAALLSVAALGVVAVYRRRKEQ